MLSNFFSWLSQNRNYDIQTFTIINVGYVVYVYFIQDITMYQIKYTPNFNLNNGAINLLWKAVN